MEVCLICLENTETFIITMCNCKYNIHKECISFWLNLYKTCIICKSKITYNENYIRFNYLNREFINSKILVFFDFILNKITHYSESFDDTLIKILLFNIILTGLLFMLFIPILLYKITLSQSKYIVDTMKCNSIYSSPISFYKIKN